jgi:hypothetical protein
MEYAVALIVALTPLTIGLVSIFANRRKRRTTKRRR